MVQWLRLSAFTAGGMGLTPAQGIIGYTHHTQKKQKPKNHYTLQLCLTVSSLNWVIRMWSFIILAFVSLRVFKNTAGDGE